MEELNTARQVIKKLGGLNTVAALTSRKPKAVSNWPLFNKFPPDTYVVLKSALNAKGYEAPDSLWRMVQP